MNKNDRQDILQTFEKHARNTTLRSMERHTQFYADNQNKRESNVENYMGENRKTYKITNIKREETEVHAEEMKEQKETKCRN